MATLTPLLAQMSLLRHNCSTVGVNTMLVACIDIGTFDARMVVEKANNGEDSGSFIG